MTGRVERPAGSAGNPEETQLPQLGSTLPQNHDPVTVALVSTRSNFSTIKPFLGRISLKVVVAPQRSTAAVPTSREVWPRHIRLSLQLLKHIRGVLYVEDRSALAFRKFVWTSARPSSRKKQVLIPLRKSSNRFMQWFMQCERRWTDTSLPRHGMQQTAI